MAKPLSDVTDIASFSLAEPRLCDDAAQASLWRGEADEIVGQAVRDADRDRLGAIICAAPHLHHLAKKIAASYPSDITALFGGDIEAVLASAKSVFDSQLDKAFDDEALMQCVRTYRYRCYFALAMSELGGLLAVKRQIALLSDVAQTALQAVLGALALRHHVPSEAMVILGMGKLGARELNYSSDIDLIILYDAQNPDITAEAAIKLSRHVIQIMQKQTKDGFGWRVDMRLRPDPGATAIALSVEAAIAYYESIARSWERAVFIRARPVAGNLALGEMFLHEIAPFIWRRQRDYSILEDLVSWITHYPMSENGWQFDVKRGAYAIRHIEMLTSLLQLLHGGRDASLRTCHTDKALNALSEAGHIAADDAHAAIHLYWHWRQIEHRLQYCRDAHLYHLPNNKDDFQQFALFAGFETAAELHDRLLQLQDFTKTAASHQVINDIIAAHLGAVERGAWPSDEDSQRSFLLEKGFKRPDDTIRIIDSWMSGRHPATRSERARDTLQPLLPLVINELSKGTDIDTDFIGFAQFVEALPAGVQVFSLLYQHPRLITLISTLALSATALISELAKNPAIFEKMLDEAFFAPLGEHPDFDHEIARDIAGKTPETQLDAIRLYAKEAKFRAEVQIITYPDSAIEAHRYLSDLADACLRACFAVTQSEFEQQYGKIAGGQFAVILLGRAGLRELTPRSDIDVVFLYEADPVCQSDGAKSLSSGHYYQRLTQRLISWAGARTAAGSLFEIDTRLRPNGNSGPLATHYDSWRDYIADKAWPFEKLALQKGRLLDDDNQLTHKIATSLKAFQQTPKAPEEIAQNIALIREKLAQDRYPLWEFKKRRGGLLDCEFLDYLGGDSEAVYQLLQHLTMISAVMLVRAHNQEEPPEAFQKELCRLMQQSSFDKAKDAFDKLLSQNAAKLDDVLTRF